MANRTVKDANSIRGTNPQYLIEKIIRTRIYDSKYWKEECFALSAESLVDKAMSLRFIGGVYCGNIKTTPFISLTLKMLQIQPEKDIVVEFIRNEEFKYVRALGAFYMRLVGSALDCHKYLEPLLADSRKLRRQNQDGSFSLIHMDEYVDELLSQDRMFNVSLPRLQKRHVLEENNKLEAKVSALDDDFTDDVESSDDDKEQEVEKTQRRDRSPFDRREKMKRDRRRERDRDEDKGSHRKKNRDHERARDRHDRRDRDRRHER